MTTIGEVISRIRGQLKAEYQDSFVTDRVRELESMEEKMIIVENNSNDVKSIIDEVVQ